MRAAVKSQQARVAVFPQELRLQRGAQKQIVLLQVEMRSRQEPPRDPVQIEPRHGNGETPRVVFLETAHVGSAAKRIVKDVDAELEAPQPTRRAHHLLFVWEVCEAGSIDVETQQELPHGLVH